MSQPVTKKVVLSPRPLGFEDPDTCGWVGSGVCSCVMGGGVCGFECTVVGLLR